MTLDGLTRSGQATSFRQPLPGRLQSAMDLKRTLRSCAVLFLVSAVSSLAEDACTERDSQSLNQCLFDFVMAHSKHQAALVEYKDCRVELLNCSALSETHRCINKHHLSKTCIDSLETTINAYIANLRIPCTVSQFRAHCPYAIKISSKKTTITAVTADSNGSDGLPSMFIWSWCVAVLIYTFM